MLGRGYADMEWARCTLTLLWQVGFNRYSEQCHRSDRLLS